MLVAVTIVKTMSMLVGNILKEISLMFMLVGNMLEEISSITKTRRHLQKLLEKSKNSSISLQ